MGLTFPAFPQFHIHQHSTSIISSISIHNKALGRWLKRCRYMFSFLNWSVFIIILDTFLILCEWMENDDRMSLIQNNKSNKHKFSCLVNKCVCFVCIEPWNNNNKKEYKRLLCVFSLSTFLTYISNMWFIYTHEKLYWKIMCVRLSIYRFDLFVQT